MPALTLREILALDPVRASEPELLAGHTALDRPVRWVHSSEVYEGANFLDGGELLLTNGFGLSDPDEETRRRYVRELAARGAAGLAVEVGRSLPAMPEEVVDEARRRELPLLALHRVVPFVRITEAANRAIVARGLSGRAVVRPWGDDHTAALLADLADRAALNQPEVEARAALAGFHPGPGARLIGVSLHGTRDVGTVDRAVRLLGGAGVLRAAFPGDVLALLSLPGGRAGDPVKAVQETFRTVADSRPHGGRGPRRDRRRRLAALERHAADGAVDPGTGPDGPGGGTGLCGRRLGHLLPGAGPGARADQGWPGHQPRAPVGHGAACPGAPDGLGGGPPERPGPYPGDLLEERLFPDPHGVFAPHRPPVPVPATGTHRVLARPGHQRPGTTGRVVGGDLCTPVGGAP